MNTGKDLEPYKEQESSETSKVYTESIITMIIYHLFSTRFKLLKKHFYKTTIHKKIKLKIYFKTGILFLSKNLF